MAKPTPEELEEMVKKQSEIYGDQDPTEEPVDVDEAARNAWGNELDDDEELNIAQEIEEDEDDPHEGQLRQIWIVFWCRVIFIATKTVFVD